MLLKDRRQHHGLTHPSILKDNNRLMACSAPQTGGWGERPARFSQSELRTKRPGLNPFPFLRHVCTMKHRAKPVTRNVWQYSEEKYQLWTLSKGLKTLLKACSKSGCQHDVKLVMTFNLPTELME